MSNRTPEEAALSVVYSCWFLREVLNPPGTEPRAMSEQAAAGLGHIIDRMAKDAHAAWEHLANLPEETPEGSATVTNGGQP